MIECIVESLMMRKIFVLLFGLLSVSYGLANAGCKDYQHLWKY